MRPGRLISSIIIICLIFIVSACGETAQGAPIQKPGVQSPTSISMSQATSGASVSVVDNPIHLAIPSIKVNATIEQVSILPNGDLDTPHQDQWNNTGWYSSGTPPGQRGSSVIDGHLDRPGGSPAIFWFLRNVHVDSDVIVTMSSGKILHFHVTRIAYYRPQDAPLQGIFGDSSGTYLNLITCAGDWIPSQHQTTLRLVVYTSLS